MKFSSTRKTEDRWPCPMERDLIRELEEILGPARPPHVLFGIGDDTALLLNPGKGQDLLFTIDSQRENVHFKWQWIDPASVGYRLVVVNVSDIASKGGAPYAGVVAAGLPPDYDVEILKGVYRGIAEASREYGLPLVGGDLSREAGGWNFVMSLIGTSPESHFPVRSGLSEGDAVYLVGRPGRARSGFLSLLSERSDPLLEPAREAFRRPRALLSIGQQLVRRPEVIATIDSSDGLERSLSELAASSNLSIEVTAFPVTEEIVSWSPLLGESPEDLVWVGGEDYDIVLGVKSGGEESFEKWARETLLSKSPEGLFFIGRAKKRGTRELVLPSWAPGRISQGGGFDHTAR